MTTTTTSKSRAGAKTNVQKAAAVVAAVFVLVGLLGFIPGITSQYDQLHVAGHGSGALLLGVCQVSILHNIVHLLFGIVGLALARTAPGARSYLLYGGIIYLVLWIYGLRIDMQSAMNFVPLNDADNWLHLVLGIGMVALALLLTKKRSTAGTRNA
ncbi:DUF4383 domain-containing protein [Arthrobacter sp. Br18]|uniref:DUF4383 domain-containing protein n=1 Tax=Arthrobacter sp. Br18 TaxID=1312954 RepID=UPI000688B470|nr:DUF4383 domain-containing protein [Arthrobacter sp. Br18]